MFNLDGRIFQPVVNSDGGSVTSGTVFHFTQSGPNFTARYSGAGVTDGHLIGCFHDDTNAELIYHARTDNGSLDAGEAKAQFQKNENGMLSIEMSWRWLNGTRQSGTSEYIEITPSMAEN